MFSRLALAAALLANSAGAQISNSPREQRLVPFADRGAAREILEVLKPGLRLRDEVPPRLTQIVDRVYQAFGEVYPTLMSRKVKPEVFVVEGKTLADEFTRTVQEVPGVSYRGLVAVPSAVLEDPSDAVVLGTIAHQMAHVFFNHDDSFRVLEAWNATTPPSPLDGGLRAALVKFVENSRLIGVGDELFEGIPFGGGTLQITFDVVFREIASGPTACSSKVANERRDLEAFLRARLSAYQGTYVFTSAFEESNFRDRLQAFRVALVACRHELRPEDMGITRILQIGRSLSETMRADFSSGLQRARWRSTEDEADEAAVMILSYLALPATDFSRQVLIEAEPNEPGVVARCDDAIQARRDVPFGELGDPAHAPCYRLQQVTRFANRIMIP